MRHNKETNFEKESHFAIQDMNKTKKNIQTVGIFDFISKLT